MRLLASRPIIVALTAVSCLLMAGAAQAAMDAKKVADQLVAAVAANNPEYKATYAKTAAAGQDVVISTFKIVHVGGTSTQEIPTITVTNPIERPGGGFTSAKVVFDKGKAANKDSSVSWNTGSAEQVTFPSPDEMKKGRQVPFLKMSMAGFSILQKDAKDP